jgi:four helix bundle protein
LTVARGSVQECVPLLEIAHRKGLFQDEALTDPRDQLEVIARMLSGLIRGLNKRAT